MADRTEYGAPERSQGFNFNPDVDDANYAVNISDTMALQSQALAEHQGKIDGLTTAISAVQNSLNFWQTAGLGLAGLILAAVSIVVVLQFSNAEEIKDVGKQLGRIDRLEVKVDALEVKVDALPGRISDSLRETSRDLVLLTQSRNSTREADRPEK